MQLDDVTVDEPDRTNSGAHHRACQMRAQRADTDDHNASVAQALLPGLAQGRKARLTTEPGAPRVVAAQLFLK